MTLYTQIESPIGPLTLTSNGKALTAIWFATPKHEGMLKNLSHWRRDYAHFAEATQQLGEYFAGKRQSFTLAMAPEGTAFQQQVWMALREIPYGETISYGALARSIGNEKAVRAVGLANGRNPLAPIVPCHRVIGADGSMTGYAGGLDRKRWLLALEAQHSVKTLFS